MFRCANSKKKFILPIHLPNHWVLLTVDFKLKALEFYDTYHSSGTAIFEAVLAYINEEMTLTGEEFSKNEWKCIRNSQTPRQSDSSR